MNSEKVKKLKNDCERLQNGLLYHQKKLEQVKRNFLIFGVIVSLAGGLLIIGAGNLDTKWRSVVGLLFALAVWAFHHWLERHPEAFKPEPKITNFYDFSDFNFVGLPSKPIDDHLDSDKSVKDANDEQKQ